MGDYYVTQASLRNFKQKVSESLPGIPSSHLSEALAASLGERTYAALKAKLSTEAAVGFDSPSTPLFVRRARELGHGEALAGWRGLFQLPFGQGGTPQYSSQRAKAWRNILVAAINAGLEQRVFGLEPDDNFWSPAPESPIRPWPTGRYDFMFAPGVPAAVAVNDIGFGELSLHVALRPKQRDLVGANPAPRGVGEAYAEGWLERTLGVWLQHSGAVALRATQSMTALAAATAVTPRGFGDRGKLMM